MGQHDDVFTYCLVQVDSLADPVRREGLRRVVSGVAVKAESVELLADLLGVIECPVIIGSIDLNALIPYLCHAPDRSHQVLFQVVANGVELEPDRNVFIGGQTGPQRSRREKSEKRAT